MLCLNCLETMHFIQGCKLHIEKYRLAELGQICLSNYWVRAGWALGELVIYTRFHSISDSRVKRWPIESTCVVVHGEMVLAAKNQLHILTPDSNEVYRGLANIHVMGLQSFSGRMV